MIRTWGLACLMMLGCGAEHDSEPTDAAASEGETETADPTPPEVIDFGASTLVLTESGTVTFTAVVRDREGVDDIASGTIEDVGDPVYASMQRAENERWVASLSWQDIHRAAPIEFVDQEARTFVARFTDHAGLHDEARIVIMLTCIGIVPAACHGRCIDLDIESCD